MALAQGLHPPSCPMPLTNGATGCVQRASMPPACLGGHLEAAIADARQNAPPRVAAAHGQTQRRPHAPADAAVLLAPLVPAVGRAVRRVRALQQRAFERLSRGCRQARAGRHSSFLGAACAGSAAQPRSLAAVWQAQLLAVEHRVPRLRQQQCGGLQQGLDVLEEDLGDGKKKCQWVCVKGGQQLSGQAPTPVTGSLRQVPPWGLPRMESDPLGLKSGSEIQALPDRHTGGTVLLLPRTLVCSGEPEGEAGTAGGAVYKRRKISRALPLRLTRRESAWRKSFISTHPNTCTGPMQLVPGAPASCKMMDRQPGNRT